MTTSTQTRRIAVVGGGIAGLSAAWSLEKARRSGEPIEYTLFEAGNRVGGVIGSETIEGCVVEAGPDSFLTEKSAAAQLCRELGIGDQLLPSNDAQRKIYIVVGKRLVPLPDGLVFMVPTKLMPTALTRLFSWRTKLRMVREYLFPPAPVDHDEAVAEMTRRHYGQEIVDRLVSPLLSGIYGGNASQLSVRAVLPRMVQMEREHRSLTRAMLAARKNRPAGALPPLFTSLRDGMSQMVDAVAAQLAPGSVRLAVAVNALSRAPGAWLVESADGSEPFDAVILALPVWASALLLAPIDPPLAGALGGVAYTSSITVSLGYTVEQLQRLPTGFGFLVPRTEKRAMLACTFVHQKFAGRVPEGKGLLRCFLSGSGSSSDSDALFEESDLRLTEIVLGELDEILGLKAKPQFVRIHRSRRGMAQYGVGHLERMEVVRDRVAQLPALAVAGNAYQGIGVPDCIRAGQDAAKSVLERIHAADAARSAGSLDAAPLSGIRQHEQV